MKCFASGLTHGLAATVRGPGRLTAMGASLQQRDSGLLSAVTTTAPG